MDVLILDGHLLRGPRAGRTFILRAPPFTPTASNLDALALVAPLQPGMTLGSMFPRRHKRGLSGVIRPMKSNSAE